MTFSDGTNNVVLTGVTNTTDLTTVDLSSLSDGPITASITVTDNASNSATGTGDTITKDIVAPTATVAITAIADDTGTPGDFITSDTTLTVSGSNSVLGASEKIQISSDGGTTWTDVAQPIGATTWSYADPTEHPTNVTYQVQVVDAAGNVGNTASQTVTITATDITPPDPPVITSVSDNVDPVQVTFTNPTATNATNDDTPTLTITAEAGSTVTVSNQFGPLGQAIETPIAGTFIFTVPFDSLSNDTYQFTATATDAANNTSDPSAPFSITVDTVADAAPTASVTFNDTLAEDSFINNSEKTAVGYTVAGVDPDATATVTFSDGTNNVVLTGVTNTTDLTTVDLSSLSDGPITASITVTDNASNSATGTGDTITKDTVADAAPTASVTFNDTLAEDSFINNSEKTAVGYTVAGVDPDATATVTFSDGTNNVVLTGVTNTTDLTTVDLSSLSDGPITASITVTDNASNSATGTGDTITKDTVADAAPTASVTFNDTLAEDSFINNSEKTAVGYTVAGVDPDATATVTFSDGTNNVVLTGVTNTTDLTTVDLSSLSDGPITASITVTDNASNSATGTGDTITKDIVAPTATVAITAIADDTGTPGDFITSDTTLTVSGSNSVLGASEKIQISSDGGTTWTDVAQPIGATTWSYADPTEHPTNVTYQVQVVDAAGNVGNTASQTVTIDTPQQ